MTKILIDRALFEEAYQLLHYIVEPKTGKVLPHVKKLIERLLAASNEATAPDRKPLTEEEIDDIWDCTFSQDDPSRTRSFRQIITRAIERAHGITGERA